MRNIDGTSFDKIRVTNTHITDSQISTLSNDDHALVLIQQWGPNKKNKLYKERGTNMIYGYGYASVFRDSTGNHNNTLKKVIVQLK